MPKRLTEMNSVDKRFFCLGVFVVALVMCIFKPDVTARAVRRLLNERL